MLNRICHAAIAALILCGSFVSAATVNDQWKLAVSGDWTNAGNWIGNGQYPNNDANNTYLALIAATGSPYTVTLNNATGINVGSLNLNSASATLNMTGGTFSTSTGATVSRGTFNLGGGTLSGATFTISSGAVFNVTGWAYALNTIVNNGTMNIASGNELELKGGSVLNSGYINITNNNSFPRTPTFSYSGLEPINNTGTIVFNSTTTGSVNSVVNNIGGTLLANSGVVFFGNNGLNFSGNSTVSGAGTFLYSNSSYIAGDGTFTNSGTLTFNAGRTQLFGNTVNNGKIVFNGSTDFQQGGLLGSGSYNVGSSAAATFGTGTQYPHVIGSTLNNAGTITIDPGHYLQFDSGTFNNSGYLRMTTSGTLGTAFSPYYSTTVGNHFTNTGTMSIDNGTQFKIPIANSGTMIFNGGYVPFTAGATFSGASTLSGSGSVLFSVGSYSDNTGNYVNSGTLNFTPTLGVALNNATFTNSGLLNVSALGTSTLCTGICALVNTGTIALSNGTFNGATAYNSGATYSANNGTLLLNNATYNNYNHDFSFSGNSYLGGAGTFLTSYSTFNNAANSNLILGLNLLDAEYRRINNDGTIQVTGNVRLYQEDINGTGTVIINRGGTLNYGCYSTAISNTVINNGTLTVNYDDKMILSGATLINNYYFNMNDGSNTFLLGSGSNTNNLFQNTGTIVANAVSYATFGNPIQVPFDNNSGTIIVNSGTVELGAATASFSGTSTVSGAGTMAIASGKVWNYSFLNLNSVVNQKGGLFSTSGTAYLNNRYDLNGGTFNNDGTTFYNKVLSLNGGTFANGGLLNGAGTFIINGGAYTTDGATQINGPLVFNGGTINGSGTVYSAATFSVGTLSAPPVISTRVVNNGKLTLANTNATLVLADGTLTNNGSMQINAAGAAFTPLSASGYSQLTNNGTLAFNPSNTITASTLSISSVPLQNTGTLIVAPRTLVQLNGSSPAFANGVLSSGTWIVNSVGTLDLIGGPTLTKNAAAVYLVNSGRFNALSTVTQNTGTIALQNGSALTLANGFYNSGTLADTNNNSFYFSTAGSFTNAGTLTGLIWSYAPLTMTGNSVIGSLNGSAAVTVAANANASVGQIIRAGSITVADHGSLRIAAGGGTLGTVVTSGLDLTASGGKFDLADHDMVIYYTGASPYASVRDAAARGYANGAWNGPGLDSSLATVGRALGVADSVDVYGSTYASFSGQPINSPTKAVLVKYTYAGDANLDGKVDIVDLGLLAGNWHGSGGWYQGDFNYDGKIDIVDLGALAGDWHFGSAGSLMTFAKAMTLVDLGGSVPEPSVLATISLCAVLMRRRA